MKILQKRSTSGLFIRVKRYVVETISTGLPNWNLNFTKRGQCVMCSDEHNI